MLVDIAIIREMVQTNEIQITWMEKEKQVMKVGSSSKIIGDILNCRKMIDL